MNASPKAMILVGVKGSKTVPDPHPLSKTSQIKGLDNIAQRKQLTHGFTNIQNLQTIAIV
jgi:hypothetical protein